MPCVSLIVGVLSCNRGAPLWQTNPPHQVKMIQLPIIDIAPFLQDATATNSAVDLAAAKARCAKDMDAACRNFGFFYLTGHGIPAQDMTAILELTRSFFLNTSEEDKLKISITADSVRGYQRLGQNVTQQRKDWHEAIDLYAPVNRPDHPIHPLTSSPLLKGENPYPSPHFKSIVESYVSQCRVVGTACMRAMATALGCDNEQFFDTLTDDSFWVLRLIGYPPLSEGVKSDGDVGVSCGEHTDYGCLTILNQDHNTGALQVYCKATNDWINAEPIPGCFVVNIGDMVNVWTKNQYQATRHRVIHQKKTYRVSAPFFFEPNVDAVVRPLSFVKTNSPDEEDAAEKGVVYGLHLLNKVSNNFGKY